jgi:hypothetical protein
MYAQNLQVHCPVRRKLSLNTTLEEAHKQQTRLYLLDSLESSPCYKAERADKSATGKRDQLYDLVDRLLVVVYSSEKGQLSNLEISFSYIPGPLHRNEANPEYTNNDIPKFDNWPFYKEYMTTTRLSTRSYS